MMASQTLTEPDGIDAIKYLKSEKRNFTDLMIQKAIAEFNIGYMPPFVKNEYGDTHEFAGRVILPIYDHYGSLIALDSRDFRPNTNKKFLHESFCKNCYLYGLNVSKKHIISKKRAIVVEGGFDSIYLHLNGFKENVSVLSSNLNLYQISLLCRYTHKIFVVFDGDNAGKESILKLETLYETKMLYGYFVDLIPVLLPEKHDPDEFIKKYGSSVFEELLKKSEEDFCRKQKENVI